MSYVLQMWCDARLSEGCHATVRQGASGGPVEALRAELNLQAQRDGWAQRRSASRGSVRWCCPACLRVIDEK